MPPDPPLSGSSNASPAHGILSGDFEARLSANDTRHDSTSAAAAAAAAAAVAPPDIPASTASHHSATPLSAHLNRGPTSLMDMSSGGDVVHAPTLSSPGRTPSHTPSAGGVVSSLNPNADPYHGPSTDFRDGRVRNPVPTKLQNQTSIKDGNFSVMHMDRASARSAVDERDMAAKRSSEATQAAAMDAYSKGYQPLKRGRQTWRPSSPADQQQQPPHPNVSYDATSRAMPSPNHPYMMPPSASSSSSTYRMPGMQPSEVKAEQARLLTFLRSLHPMMVVDQLCKAVAYFGGIPGAPPLADTGTFPTSERGNGNGALIISWLAEIFPPTDPSQPPPMPYSGSSVSVLGDVEGKDASQADAATGQSGDADGETPVRRARGRPKGSKSTKTRRDKGMKKGQRLGPEYQDDLLAQDPYQTQDPSSATDAQGNPGVRKRGRPKGSKNRPKPPPSDNAPQDHEGDSSLSNSGPVSRELPPVGTPNAQHAQHAQHAQFHAPFPHGQPSQRPTGLTTEATLSLHAQNWADPPAPTPRPDGMPNDLAAAMDMSRKRSSDQQQQQQQQQQQHFGNMGHPQLQGDYQQPKRRRFSGDAHPSPATMVMDAQASAEGPSPGDTGARHSLGGAQSPPGQPQHQYRRQQLQAPHHAQQQQPPPQAFPSQQQQQQQPQQATNPRHQNGIKPHFGMPQQQQPQQPGYYGPQQPPQQRPGQFGNQPPPGAAFGGNAGGNGLMNMPYAMTSNHAAAAALHQQQQHHHPGTSGSGTGPGGPGPGPGSASSPSYGAQPPPHLQAAAMGGDRPMQDSMYDVFNNRR